MIQHNKWLSKHSFITEILYPYGDRETMLTFPKQRNIILWKSIN